MRPRTTHHLEQLILVTCSPEQRAKFLIDEIEN